MPDSPRRAILFDLDGTLVDTITLLLESVRHAFKGRTGRVPTDEEWISGIGTPLASQLRPYATNEADVSALEQSYRGYQRANLDRLTHAYSGVVDTLRTLHERGHPMAVVTSKSNGMAIRTVDYVGLAPYFASSSGRNPPRATSRTRRPSSTRSNSYTPLLQARCSSATPPTTSAPATPRASSRSPQSGASTRAPSWKQRTQPTSSNTSAACRSYWTLSRTDTAPVLTGRHMDAIAGPQFAANASTGFTRVVRHAGTLAAANATTANAPAAPTK